MSDFLKILSKKKNEWHSFLVLIIKLLKTSDKEKKNLKSSQSEKETLW